MANRVFYLLAIFLLALSVENIRADAYNWEFTLSTQGWVNTGDRDWIWTGDALPDNETLVPDTYGNYIWLQDNDAPPSTGTFSNTANITLYPNDIICIKIYRHQSVINGNENPILNFVTDDDSHKQGLLWTYNYDVWDTVELICGSRGEPCCLTYPCTGHFSVDGKVDAHGDVLAFDSVGLNAGCSIPQTTPTTQHTELTTTTAEESSRCCTFEDEHLCGWSPSLISNGWLWSRFIEPCTTFELPPDSIIYAISVQANVYSPIISDVYDQTTTFTFDYYYWSTIAPPNDANKFQVGFIPTGSSLDGPHAVWHLSLPGYETWATKTVFCNSTDSTNCCYPFGPGPCSGIFYAELLGIPLSYFPAGLNNFAVDNATC